MSFVFDPVVLSYFLLLVLRVHIFCKVSISNGELARDSEYPHLVSIFKNRDAEFHFCAGGLINKNTVLTAAHCFNDDDDPANFAIQAGTIDLSETSNGIIANVENFLIHPLWDPDLVDENNNEINDYDIALLYLRQDIPENGENIRYMNVASGNCSLAPKYVDVSGWGYYDSSTERDYQLRRVIIPVRDKCDCDVCKEEIQICAGDGDGKDTCQGDSGSPLTKVFSADDTRWTAYGILSFGDTGCGVLGNYGVYTRVCAFQDWIWENADMPTMGYSISPLPYLQERFDPTINYMCYGEYSTSPSVCRGHGVCLPSGECVCEILYSGYNCKDFSCFGEDANSDLVCNSKGKCTDANTCLCYEDYSGSACEVPPSEVTLKGAFGNPLFFIVGGIILASVTITVVCVAVFCFVFFVIYYQCVAKRKKANERGVRLDSFDEGSLPETQGKEDDYSVYENSIDQS